MVQYIKVTKSWYVYLSDLNDHHSWCSGTCSPLTTHSVQGHVHHSPLTAFRGMFTTHGVQGHVRHSPLTDNCQCHVSWWTEWSCVTFIFIMPKLSTFSLSPSVTGGYQKQMDSWNRTLLKINTIIQRQITVDRTGHCATDPSSQQGISHNW